MTPRMRSWLRPSDDCARSPAARRRLRGRRCARGGSLVGRRTAGEEGYTDLRCPDHVALRKGVGVVQSDPERLLDILNAALWTDRKSTRLNSSHLVTSN